MSHPDAVPGGVEPRRGGLLAGLVFAVTTLTLTWPLLGGRILLGDDQLLSGYAFRRFGAEFFRQTGSIPEWNPYLFGGLPFVAAQHGDIFYPTAWLRWFMPTDVVFGLSYALHLLLAGWFTFLLLRALRTGWTAAVVGGVAYQLSGIVASLVSPGHDGKLFVSALAPLAFFALVRAIRDRRIWGYGVLALTVGLCMVSPHYQMTYYLLVALGLWTLWLVFGDEHRPATLRWPVALGAALGAVLVGIAIAAIQVWPFLGYIPFSPRAAGGPSGGWEYAIQFSMPIEELATTLLPQFNGVLENYWGRNFFKLHTEYLGAVVLILAAFGIADRARRRVVWALGGILVLFLLVSFGGHTPFYRLWYAIMPMMDKVRAPGMAFFLVALPVAVLAGFGTDRLLRGGVSARAALIAGGVVVLIALLGLAGVLQSVAYGLADPRLGERVAMNEPALRTGSLRLLVVGLLATALCWAIAAGRLRGAIAAVALVALTTADLWSIDRRFFHFVPGREVTFGEDAITRTLAAVPAPYRVLDVPPQIGGAGYPVYQGSALMAHDVPTVLGYHGNELRYYDELLGGKNVWANLLNPQVLDLVAARYLILRQPQPLPGWHEVVSADNVASGGPGVLMERDTIPAYARVTDAAAKLPPEQIVPTLVDPGFPASRIVLYSDTASLTPAPLDGGLPAASPVAATVADWAPGRMRVTLDPAPTKPSYLTVAENWYPDWHAEAGGQALPVHRGNHTFLSVVVPAGVTEVSFEFRSDRYRTGRVITVLALIVTALLLAAAVVPHRRRETA